jgi:hypothetical protein
MANYLSKLKDPRWQKKRLEILDRDSFECKFCGDSTSTLHVHHLKYQGEPWEIESQYLITLCESCHEAETSNRAASEKMLLEKLRLCGATCSDIEILSEGFGDLKVTHDSNVTITVLAWAMSTEGVMNRLAELYFKSLLAKRTKESQTQAF